MMEAKYQIVNGTAYHAETPPAVVAAIEGVRASGQRIRLHYGDPDTGRDWMEEFDVTGRVGRSGGSIRVPLLLYSARSTGAPSVLDHCIVRIRPSRGGGHDLYRHPKYHVVEGPVAVRRTRKVHRLPDGRQLRWAVTVSGDEHARFETEAKARRWIVKMGLSA